MLRNYLITNIKNKFEYEPTPGQNTLIKKLGDFVACKDTGEILLIKGYAGTGKTALISALVKTLDEHKQKTVLMAPTGRAAKVLSSYAKKNAFTIHKKIYRQSSSKDGFGKFKLDRNLHSHTLFIVDEASMISNINSQQSIFGSGRLLDDLIEYIFQQDNCKLILIGDTAQLPPVGIEISPALNARTLEMYNLRADEFALTDIVRQAQDSGILYNATNIRNLISESLPEKQIPEFNITDYHDIQKTNGEELIEEISTAYSTFGLEETIILSRSNKRANRFNQGIRNMILYREDEINTSDLLMVVKNNYFWIQDDELIDFIANGDIMEIMRIHRFEEKYNHRFADVTIRLIDYVDKELDVTVILDAITSESAALPAKENEKLFYTILEDYQHLNTAKKQYEAVRQDKYFNALQVKFAYAITCHKAQGGQWKAVFVDQGYFTEEMINVEYLRWLYTAFTRATEKLFLVNFNEAFFNEK